MFSLKKKKKKKKVRDMKQKNKLSGVNFFLPLFFSGEFAENFSEEKNHPSMSRSEEDRNTNSYGIHNVSEFSMHRQRLIK